MLGANAATVIGPFLKTSQEKRVDGKQKIGWLENCVSMQAQRLCLAGPMVIDRQVPPTESDRGGRSWLLFLIGGSGD